MNNKSVSASCIKLLVGNISSICCSPKGETGCTWCRLILIYWTLQQEAPGTTAAVSRLWPDRTNMAWWEMFSMENIHHWSPTEGCFQISRTGRASTPQLSSQVSRQLLEVDTGPCRGHLFDVMDGKANWKWINRRYISKKQHVPTNPITVSSKLPLFWAVSPFNRSKGTVETLWRLYCTWLLCLVTAGLLLYFSSSVLQRNVITLNNYTSVCG